MPPTPNPWILTTPSSRGLGFAITRRLLQTTELPVVATARSDVDGVKGRLLEDLEGLDGKRVEEGRLRVLKMDVEGTIDIQSRTSNSALREQSN